MSVRIDDPAARAQIIKDTHAEIVANLGGNPAPEINVIRRVQEFAGTGPDQLIKASLGSLAEHDLRQYSDGVTASANCYETARVLTPTKRLQTLLSRGLPYDGVFVVAEDGRVDESTVDRRTPKSIEGRALQYGPARYFGSTLTREEHAYIEAWRELDETSRVEDLWRSVSPINY